MHPFDALARRWPVYLAEAALLGAFMLAACLVVFLVQHPGSPLPRRPRSPLARRAVIGLAMGCTAVALIYSPLGALSGAHFNPAVTLAFASLGRISPADAAWYTLFQTAGGLAGVLLAGAALGPRIAHPAVAHAATTPGPRGSAVALAAEAAISFLLLSVVLLLGRTAAAPFTGLVAGALVAIFITFEAPLSGMSMNPARSIASALPARNTRALWVYLFGPTAAMLLAAAAHSAAFGPLDAAPTMNPAAAHRCRVGRDAAAPRHDHAPAGIQHADAPAGANLP
ncbi:MAG: aquaporin [Phycisphaerae bacterium]|nr:aquaporin [Phycisphaerae bacterium]